MYFYKSGLAAGPSNIESYTSLFHLGKETTLGLVGEKRGNVDGPQSRRKSKRTWYEGDTLNLSIGQGELLVTPIQMAVLISAVANQGILWKPKIALKIESADGRRSYEYPSRELGRIQLKPEVWTLIHKGLLEVVKAGTGRIVDLPGLIVAGKTGTTQNPLGEDHAWFVAYAGRPGEPPSLAISVLVQHGGHGASAAGPIARKVIQTAFAPPEESKAL